MSTPSTQHTQDHLDVVFLYALRTLSSDERAAAEAQIAACPDCRQEVAALQPIVGSFVSWPTDVLRPTANLWERLSHRIGREPGAAPAPQPKPEWDVAAPGIWVKILARDEEKKRVSMLVRLDPKTEYPPHRHAGIEELHLLHGELLVNERTMYPGEYLHAEGGTEDHRVYSETGCTCVLMTSTDDAIL